MTKHVSRASRWTQLGSNEYRSAVGRVYYRAGEWHAVVSYQVLDPEAPAPEQPQTWHLSGLKRPRNAMVEAERKVQELRGKYGTHLVILDPAQGGPLV
jgi:hypothetical protein